MANPPYDPEALPPDLRQLLPNHNRPAPKPYAKLSESPFSSKAVVTPPCQTEVRLAKSYAQVARWVSPQDGVTNACGLKPEKKKRKNPLTVRLSDSERAFIKAKTLAAGCSLNSYIRASVLGSKYKPPVNPELLKALLAVNKELTSQGNNLNQIARHLNGGTASPAESEGMLGVIGRSMLHTHKAIRGALVQGKSEEGMEL